MTPLKGVLTAEKKWDYTMQCMCVLHLFISSSVAFVESQQNVTLY